MLEMLASCWTLVTGLVASLWGVVCLVSVWGWDVLTLLHTDSPRLEGLLIGVLLAWVMLRRKKHPLLRVLSSPLKLVVDILDLAWDQVVEVATDLLGTAHSWATRPVAWVLGKVTGVYNWCLGRLKGLKDRLSK